MPAQKLEIKAYHLTPVFEDRDLKENEQHKFEVAISIQPQTVYIEFSQVIYYPQFRMPPFVIKTLLCLINILRVWFL